MTTQTPYEWIAAHVNKGVRLREEVYSLTTPEEGEAWADRVREWLHEARVMVEAYSPQDADRLDVIGALPLLPLSPGNPFWEPYKPISLLTSSTGVGRPGNNLANWHAGHVARLEEIAKDWRAKAPLPPRRLGAAARKGRESLASAETDCRKWLIEQLENPKTETKMDIEDEVVEDELFYGLSRKAFKRAWRDAIKEPTTDKSWRKPGPVSSSCRGDRSPNTLVT